MMVAVAERDALNGQLSLAVVYQRHYAGMVRVAALILDSREGAEEIVQDCFVAMHRRWDRIEHPERYLRSSVVNRCRSELRRRRLLRRLPGVVPAPPREPELLTDALQTLSTRQRTALVLRFYGDLDDEMIAAALGVRPATVRSLIHRGLARLREVIEP
jgi:DNA-directed RNA polymerase specialized sigma24 family protein